MLFCFDSKQFKWEPTDTHDWSLEFESMKNEVCEYFGLLNNKNLLFEGDDDIEIQDEDDLDAAWEILTQNNNDLFAKIIVKGDISHLSVKHTLKNFFVD